MGFCLSKVGLGIRSVIGRNESWINGGIFWRKYFCRHRRLAIELHQLTEQTFHLSFFLLGFAFMLFLLHSNHGGNDLREHDESRCVFSLLCLGYMSQQGGCFLK